jgi:hypothetical protein
MRAKGFNKPLGHGSAKGRCYQVGLHGKSFIPHGKKAMHYGGRVVRMERGKNEVPRNTGLKSHMYRFRIPQLPYHDNIGIRPKYGPKSPGKFEDISYNLNLMRSR